MAGNVCAICHGPLSAVSGKPPTPTICDDCIVEKLWNVKLDGDVGPMAMFQPQPPSKPARRQRAA